MNESTIYLISVSGCIAVVIVAAALRAWRRWRDEWVKRDLPFLIKKRAKVYVMTDLGLLLLPARVGGTVTRCHAWDADCKVVPVEALYVQRKNCR